MQERVTEGGFGPAVPREPASPRKAMTPHSVQQQKDALLRQALEDAETAVAVLQSRLMGAQEAKQQAEAKLRQVSGTICYSMRICSFKVLREVRCN